MTPRMPRATKVATPMEALRKHWRLAAVVTLAFTLLGVLAGVSREAVYTAEMRLAVGAGQLSTLSVPGFPTASEDLASSYARWVTTVGVGEMSLPDGALSLSASPIPESNVIRIEGTSRDSDVALETTETAAAALQDEINTVRTGNDPEELLTQIRDLSAEELRLDLAVNRARGAYEAALEEDAPNTEDLYDTYVQQETSRNETKLQKEAMEARYLRVVADKTTEADLRTIGQGAVVTGNDKASTIQKMGLLGFGAGGILSLIGATILERRRARSVL